MRKSIAAVVVALVLCLAGGAGAEGPAVSGVNGKVEGIAGEVDAKGAGFGAGSLSFPLTESFGAQIDLAGGVIDDGRSVKGAAAHLFWRDPDQGLIGATVTRAGRGSQFFNRFGAEGEYYGADWTLALRGGYQNGQLDHSGYGAGDFRWYVTDDLMLEAGVRAVGDDRQGRIGVEWQLELDQAPSGLVMFADTGVGDEGYTHVLAGLRFHFGGSKSLKRRHREDDPENGVIDDVLTNTNQFDDDGDGGSGSGTSGGGAGGGPPPGDPPGGPPPPDDDPPGEIT